MLDRQLHKILPSLSVMGSRCSVQVFAIYRSFEHLLPDAPELVEKVLLDEADPSTKRNAFLMLFQVHKGLSFPLTFPSCFRFVHVLCWPRVPSPCSRWLRVLLNTGEPGARCRFPDRQP